MVALVPFLSLFSSYFLEYAELLDKCSKKAEEVSGKRNVLGVEGKKEEKDGEGSAGEGTVMMFRVEIQDTTLIIPHSCHVSFLFSFFFFFLFFFDSYCFISFRKMKDLCLVLSDLS